jgi:tetratricopeptide (TPR) repeat protein
MKQSLQRTSSLAKILQHNIVSVLLYLTLYALISAKFNTYFKPFAGMSIIFTALATDIILSLKQIRIYLRLLIFILIYIILRSLVHLLSSLASPADTLNVFDSLPYLFDRDTIIACAIMVFYFFFDALRIRKHTHTFYLLSTVGLAAMFMMLFSFQETVQNSIFGNWMAYSLILVWSVILFLLRHITYTQNRSGHTARTRDLGLFLLLVLPLVLMLFLIMLPRHIEESGSAQSGLFEQNLFEFDFSKLLQLQDQIKLSDDRVLIMELGGTRASINKRVNRGWKRQIYLKRFSLEEYTNDGSFRMSETIPDPHAPPIFISGYKWELDDPPLYRDRAEITQTLYLVNIDSSSLLGSTLLQKVAPITLWDEAPYKQIYRSYSSVFDRSYFMLQNRQLNQDEFLKNIDPRRKKQLLHFGTESETEQKIAQLARDITGNMQSDFMKARLIEQHLRDNYWYSLSPGTAPDGDQLGHFLFTSEKGYCTYFAFTMVLMLRSLGIASRVAVGFAPDMENRTMNFYDVRALDGHAWVEVYFDEYGWLTFDPTSADVHPDEDFEFAMGNKEERDDLIEDILKNRDNMQEITREKDTADELLDNIQYMLKQSIRWTGIILFILITGGLVLLLFIRKKYYLIRYKLAITPREKIIYLYRHCLGELLDMGYPIQPGESLLEYGERLDADGIVNLHSLTELYQEALFKNSSVITLDPGTLAGEAEAIKKSLRSIPTGKKVRAFFNISRLWRRILPLLLCLFLFFMTPGDAVAQQPDDEASENIVLQEFDIYSMLREARSAANSGYYDQALEILEEAESKYPESYRPNYQKGKLYYSHELYENALLEFHKAKEKGYKNEDIYLNLASSYGRLGEDHKAVAVYEEAYDTLYRSRDIYDNLGWMYFKTHDIDKGIEIVEEGLDRYNNSADLLMTLGTLYSAKWDYARSKQYYLDSIKYSLQDFKSNQFRAIVYYDLALLEQAFLNYEYALQASNASLSLKNRSSAHMQLNYLYMGALDLKSAYREVVQASSLAPPTLFPRQSLAHIYLYAGFPDKALEIAEELLEEKDFSWMLYFGINREAFNAEVYGIIADIYRMKANQLPFTRERGVIPALAAPFTGIYYRTLGLLYNLRSANIFIKISDEKRKGGNELESLHMLRDAWEDLYAGKSLKMLRLAASIEIPINPAKERLYNIDEAILEKKARPFYSRRKMQQKLESALREIDPGWERYYQATALLAMAVAGSGSEREEYVNRLYSVHPPMAALHGLKLAAVIKFDAGIDKKLQRSLSDAIAGRGVDPEITARYSIEIRRISDNTFSMSVYDSGLEIDSRQVSLSTSEQENTADSISKHLFEFLFTIELQ